MKKNLRYADALVLFAGVAGLALRLLYRATGLDEKGLYVSGHPAWIGVCVLTAAVILALYAVTRQPGKEKDYERNYPASLPGAIGCCLAAAGVLKAGLQTVENDLLSMAAALLAAVAAVGMVWAGVCRYKGKKPPFFGFAAMSLFFTARAFLMGRMLGSEPQLSVCLPEILPSLAMVPASYCLWGFSVGMGERDKTLLWGLTAAYICLIASMGTESWLLHLCCAVFTLTNLCSRQQLEPLPEEAPEAEAAPEVQQPEMLSD